MWPLWSSWALDAEAVCSQNGFHWPETQIAHRKSICVWISSCRSCVQRNHCPNKLEGSSVLQKVQKVFNLCFFLLFLQGESHWETVEAGAEPPPFGRWFGRRGAAVCLTAVWSANCTPEPTFTLSHSHWPTFTSILMQPGTEPKDPVALGNFPFPTPHKCFEQCRVSKRGWTKGNPTASRTDTCSTSGDSTICPQVMPYEVKGGGRNQCCCCSCLHCDCSRWEQGASKPGVPPWQLSTVLKFTPKDLGQWKFLREKRTKENSCLKLIDMKSLQHKRWTAELLTVKEMSLNNSKEKRTLLFSSQVPLRADTLWYQSESVFQIS